VNRVTECERTTQSLRPPLPIRCYLKFMKREMWGVSHFYALEENPGRDGYHVHALWCDCLNKSRRDLWQKWFAQYGRNRIEPVKSRDDVSDYAAKYVTKDGAWWGVKLVDHRHPAFKDFKLVMERERTNNNLCGCWGSCQRA
jgi:hypothetical protein